MDSPLEGNEPEAEKFRSETHANAQLHNNLNGHAPYSENGHAYANNEHLEISSSGIRNVFKEALLNEDKVKESNLSLAVAISEQKFANLLEFADAKYTQSKNRLKHEIEELQKDSLRWKKYFQSLQEKISRREETQIELNRQKQKEKEEIKAIEDKIKVFDPEIFRVKEEHKKAEAKRKEEDVKMKEFQDAVKVAAIKKGCSKLSKQKTDQILVDLFEIYIGVLRNTARANSEEVGRYLKEPVGTQVVMKGLDPGKIDQANVPTYREFITKYKGTFVATDPKYKDFVPLYEFINFVSHISAFYHEESTLKATFRKLEEDKKALGIELTKMLSGVETATVKELDEEITLLKKEKTIINEQMRLKEEALSKKSSEFENFNSHFTAGFPSVAINEAQLYGH